MGWDITKYGHKAGWRLERIKKNYKYFSQPSNNIHIACDSRMKEVARAKSVSELYSKLFEKEN